MFTDSKTLKDSILSTKQIEEKDLRRDIAWIKERCNEYSESRISSVTHVVTKDMIADCLTKKERTNPGKLLKIIQSAQMPDFINGKVSHLSL